MSEAVRWFLAIQMMVGAGWLIIVVLRRLPLSATAVLRISRVLMVAALVLPVLVAWLALRTPWSPETQVWAMAEQLALAPTVRTLSPGARPTLWAMLPSLPRQPWPFLLYGSVILAVVRSVLSWTKLRGIVARSELHEARADVEVRLSDEVRVPFAVWFPGRRIVVMDRETVQHPQDYEVSLIHECQHHAEHDPFFAYVWILVQSLCIANPFVHLWGRVVGDLEEFACDERVLATAGVRPKAYGQCLVRAARRAVEGDGLALASSLTRHGQQSLLHRRLTRMAEGTATPGRSLVGLVSSLSLFGGVAIGTDAVLVGPGLSGRILEELAVEASSLELGTPQDAAMVYALKNLAGDPEGYRFVRRGWFRGEDEIKVVQDLLTERGLPPELAAVPLVESGFARLPPRTEDDVAGVWRLAPSTARAYGLSVDERRDERLNLEAATGAAAVLFADLHEEFGDWGLVLAAYNQGARHVREAIRSEGTDDPWELRDRGAINEYPAMVMAGAVLLRHPQYLRGR